MARVTKIVYKDVLNISFSEAIKSSKLSFFSDEDYNGLF